MDHMDYFSNHSDSKSTSNGSDNQTLSDSFNALSFDSASGFSDYSPSEFDPQDFVNGMIFVCDESTTGDMFKHQIFGLPIPYLREMKMLIPGRSALFLIEKQTSLIRGVFVPTCPAKKLINDKIWLRKDQCSYPSQIQFELHSSFPALPKDSELAPAFLRRMKIKGKFLDKHRVSQLIRALATFKTQQSQLFNCSYPSPMNPINSILSVLSPPSPHGGPLRSDYGMTPRNYFPRPSPTSGLTPEQLLYIERYIQEKRLLNRSMNNQMGVPLSPNGMSMPSMMQNHNDLFMQNMMNMCADWFPPAFPNNRGRTNEMSFPSRESLV